jgi:CRISPR/Cas system-associated exonuclease Cas4 (RecB family)
MGGTNGLLSNNASVRWLYLGYFNPWHRISDLSQNQKELTMQILCSDTNEEMTHEACLAHALLTGRPPCGFDYMLLKSLYASNQKPERASEIHVTDLTGCQLRAFYDKREPSPEYPHEILLRWMGSGFHKMVESEDTNLESELALEVEGIVGRTDIVYKDGRLVDLKFTRWMMPDKLPYGSHVLQVNIYAWMLRRMGRDVNRVQIQYIDASGPTKCRAHKIPVRNIDGVLACPKCLTAPKNAHLGVYLLDVPLYSDEQVEDIISERKRDLRAALDMGFPPEPEPSFLCGYCPHREKCPAEISMIQE